MKSTKLAVTRPRCGMKVSTQLKVGDGAAGLATNKASNALQEQLAKASADESF